MLRRKGLKKLWCCGIGFNWPFVKIGDREFKTLWHAKMMF